MIHILVRAACALALASACVACRVDRKTDLLRCATSSTCTPPRVCQQGYCVIDDGACPSRCTGGCDLSTNPPTCIVDGTGGDSFDCPSDMQCTVTCNGTGACGDITCDQGCVVLCTAPGACGDVSCGSSRNGDCQITCSGGGACGAVDCSNACTCDVVCAPGDCNTNSCPSRNGTHCTNNGTSDPGTTCSSTAQSGCGSC